MEDALRALSRPVRVLAAGGTIAMRSLRLARDERAVPVLDAEELIEQVPQLTAVPALQTETLLALPGAHLALQEALELARRAAAAAKAGEGVVITTGTDTLEELAVMCALIHDAEAPIVLTGAHRPASSPGADGPANLIDAVALAGAQAASGLGAVAVFGGEIHAATTVRKLDSTGPAAFGSPITGPLGRVVEGRVWLSALPLRPPAIPVSRIEHRAEIVTSSLGDDGALLRHAAQSADGVVLVVLGAGHLAPIVLGELRRAAQIIPVLVTCRPERSSMLFATYGFEGSELDVRASGAVCVPFLSAPAARVALLCCLGAGFDRGGIEAALSQWDAG